MEAQHPSSARAVSLAEQLAEERRRRHVAEAQLDRRYERLNDDPTSDCFIYAADNDSRLTYLSPSVERILGHTPEAMLGQDWRRYMDQTAASFSMAEDNEKELLDGADSPNKLISLKRADGQTMWMEVSPRALFSPTGEVIGHEGVCRMVSRADETESRLRIASQELEVRVRRRTAELEYRVQFEKLLVSLSTGFLNVVGDELDGVVRDSLRRIGEFTGVDRCGLSLLECEIVGEAKRHEWRADDGEPVHEFASRLPREAFAWEFARLAQGEPLVFNDTSELPPGVNGLRQVYERFGTRSALHLPLLGGGELIGMLVLTTRHRKLTWRQEHIDLLRVLAEVVTSTLQRRHAQSQLAVSEQRLREIVRDQTELILRWTPDRGHLFVNDAVCRFFGKSPEEILGASVLDNIHREDLPRVREKLAALTPEAPLAVDEHRVVRNDGSLAWYQWVDRALFDPAGNLVEYQSVGRDITSLKRTQQELERRLAFEDFLLSVSARMINPPREQRDQTIADTLESLVRFTKVDRGYLYLFDAEREHAVLRHGWHSERIASPPRIGTRLSIKDEVWRSAELLRGDPVVVDDVAQLPREAEHWKRWLSGFQIRSYINVPMISAGGVVGILGLASVRPGQHWLKEEVSLLRLVAEILVNTMERGAAERALEESRELLRLTIEGVEEGVYDWDIDSGRVVVSDHWLRALGLPAGENNRSQSEWQQLIHPDDLQPTSAAVARHFAGETPIFEAEYRMLHADGEYRWTLNRGRVIQRADDGRPLRMVGVDRDITRDIQARDSRRQLEAQLAHLGRVATMGETVAGIAHEVNQPLHAAATFNAAARSALKSGNLEKAESLSQKSSEQISRAGDIIRHMREYTRPRPSEIFYLDPNQLLRRSAEFVQSYNKMTRATILFDFDETLPRLQGDPIQLQQVAVNLIQNGVDAIREKAAEGEIRIRTQAQEKSVLITFSDNGRGADVDDPNELFNAFFSTKPNGMGIGLSLCRRIIEAHSGTIHAQKNATGGMSFVICIPAAEAPAT